MPHAALLLRLLRCCLPTVFLLTLPAAFAAPGPFEEGLQAYNNKDYAKAWQVWQPLLGDSRSTLDYGSKYLLSYYVGMMYEQGLGVPQNAEKAAAAYRELTDGASMNDSFIKKGQILAAGRLCEMLYYGRGVPSDPVAAASICLLASVDPAQTVAPQIAARLYSGGQGVPKDAELAAGAYLRAAQRGVVSAQLHIGTMYEQGEGVAKDIPQAIVWYERAARQGNAEAERQMVRARQIRLDYPEDGFWRQVEATRQAADAGDKDAITRLGFAYMVGNAVPVNAVAGCALVRLGSGRGCGSESLFSAAQAAQLAQLVKDMAKPGQVTRVLDAYTRKVPWGFAEREPFRPLMKTTLYAVKPGTELVIGNMPRIRSQGYLGICFGFSASTIIQSFMCRKEKLEDCAHLPPDKEFSPLFAASWANKDNEGYGVEVSEGGSSYMALYNMRETAIGYAEACYPYDEFMKMSMAVGPDEVDRIFVRARGYYDEYTKTGKTCESCLADLLHNSLKSKVSPADLKTALKAPNFGVFIQGALFGNCAYVVETPSTPSMGSFPADSVTKSTAASLLNKLETTLRERQVPVAVDGICMMFDGQKCAKGGAHSVAINGVREVCEVSRPARCRTEVKVHNSWGAKWQHDNDGGWVDGLSMFNNVSELGAYLSWFY